MNKFINIFFLIILVTLYFMVSCTYAPEEEPQDLTIHEDMDAGTEGDMLPTPYFQFLNPPICVQLVWQPWVCVGNMPTRSSPADEADSNRYTGGRQHKYLP